MCFAYSFLTCCTSLCCTTACIPRYNTAYHCRLKTIFVSHPVFLCSHCCSQERRSCCWLLRTCGSMAGWASLSIKGRVLYPSYATAIVNCLAWLPKRQRMSGESVSAEIVSLGAVLPEVIYWEREIRLGRSPSSSSGGTVWRSCWSVGWCMLNLCILLMTLCCSVYWSSFSRVCFAAMLYHQLRFWRAFVH